MPESPISSAALEVSIRSSRGSPLVRGPRSGWGTRSSSEVDGLVEVLDDEGRFDPKAFADLEQQLANEERWQDLLGLYRFGVTQVTDPEVGRDLMVKAGLLCLDQLNDLVEAEAWLRRVLASSPENLDALDGLREVCLRLSRYDEAVDFLARMVPAVALEDRGDVLFELATVTEERIDQEDRALRALWALREHPAHRNAALRRLQRLLTRNESWQELKTVLDARRDALPNYRENDANPDQEALARDFSELGDHLIRQPYLHALAETCFQSARELGDEGALTKLDQLADIRNRWAFWAKKRQEEGFEARDKREAAALYLETAQLFLQYGHDPIRAEQFLDRCFLLRPGYESALGFMETAYVELGRQQDLVAKFSSLVSGIKEPSKRAGLLLRVARIMRDMFNCGEAFTVDQVIEAYRAAAAGDAKSVEAIDELQVLLRENERYEAQAAVLEARLEALGDSYQRTRTHLELGRLYAERLGDVDRARVHYEAVLAQDAHKLEARSALRALYRDSRESGLLLEVLKGLVECSPDRASRLTLLREAAEVAESVSDEELFFALRRILELEAGPRELIHRMMALADRTGQTIALAEALEAVARTRKGEVRSQLMAQAGELYDERLARPKDAIRAYRDSLDCEPGNGSVRDALEKLLARQDDPEALRDLLRSQVTRDGVDVQEQVLLFDKLGMVLSRDLDDAEGAREAFRQVLEREPNHVGALASLDAIYEARKEWGPLAEILFRREAMAETSADRAELRFRHAALLDGVLGRSDEAAKLWVEAVLGYPEHRASVAALERLVRERPFDENVVRALEITYAAQRNYRDQLSMLSILVDNTEDPADRADLLMRSVRIGLERLDDRSGALKLLGDAIEQQPGHPEARELYVRLAIGLAQERHVCERLEKIADQDGTAAEDAAQLLLVVGELRENRLSNRPGAIEAYRRALDLDMTQSAPVSALERLYGLEGRFEDLAELLQVRMESAEQIEAKTQLGLALGSILSQRLQRPEAAQALYESLVVQSNSDRRILFRLRDVLRERGLDGPCVVILERIWESQDDLQIRVQAGLEEAQLLLKALNQPERALARYEQILQLAPDESGVADGLTVLVQNPELETRAAELLSGLYLSTGEYRRYVGMVERQLRRVDDRAQRWTLFDNLARIFIERLNDPYGAFDALAAAFRESLLPKAREVDLVEMARRGKRLRDLAEILEDALSTKEDLGRRRFLARLYGDALADSGRARPLWEKVLEAQPGDEEALSALEQIHEAGGDPEALARILVVRAETVDDVDEKVGLLRRAAAIYDEAAGQAEVASDLLLQATVLTPSDRSLWQELRRVSILVDDRPRQKAAIEGELAVVENASQRAELFSQLARVDAELGLFDEAVERFQDALRAQPTSHAARDGLAALLPTSAGQSAALVLEPVYRSTGDWSELVGVYEYLASKTVDSAERVERLTAMRSIYEERLGDDERAFGVAAEAYREAPASEALVRALERLARKTGRVSEFVTTVSEAAARFPTGSRERVQALLGLAAFVEETDQGPKQVIEAYRLVVREDPQNLSALNALLRLYTIADDARGLVFVLRSLAVCAEDVDQRAEHLRRAASILEDRLQDRGTAISTLREVLSLRPGDRHALEALDRLYEGERNHVERKRVLEMRISGSTGHDRAILQVELAELFAKGLADPGAASGPLVEVIGRIEALPAATRERAISFAKWLAQSCTETAPNVASHVANCLEPVLLRQGDAFGVMAMKEVQLSAIEDPQTRRAALMGIAQYYEHGLSDLPEAFLAVSRAWSGDPHALDLLDELDRLAVASEMQEELLEAYKKGLSKLEASESRVNLSRRAGARARAFGRPKQAAEFLEEIIADNPRDEASLTELESLYRELQDTAALLHVFRRRADACDDVDERAQMLAKIADVHAEQRKDLAAAVSMYREVVDLVPSRRYLRRWTEIAEQAEDFSALEESLVKSFADAGESEKPELLLRIGGLRFERLDDPAGSVEAYGAVFDHDAESAEAIAGLMKVMRAGLRGAPEAADLLRGPLAATADFEGYAECLQVLADAAVPGEERSKRLLVVAKAYEDQLNDPIRALPFLERAVLEFPGSGPRAMIREYGRRHGQMDGVVAFFENAAGEELDSERLGSILESLAQIAEEDSQQPDRAIHYYSRVLECVPANVGALRALERLYRATGQFDALSDIYRRRIAQAQDDATQVALLGEFARLQDEALDEPAAALATLRRILEIDPDHELALERFARISGRLGRHSEQSGALQRLASLQAEDRDPVLNRWAQLELGKLRIAQGDVQGGAGLLEQVVASDPANQKTFDFLRELFEEVKLREDDSSAAPLGRILGMCLAARKAWPAFVDTLSVSVARESNPTIRARSYFALANTYRDHLKRPELAFASLGKALADNPADHDVRSHLVQLGTSLDLVDDVVELLEGASVQVNETEAAGIEMELAQLCEQVVGDHEKALLWWSKVLVRTPSHPLALEAVDRLSERLGRWAALSDILEKRISVANDEDSVVLLLRLAQVWEVQLQESDEAIRVLWRAHESHPGDPESLRGLARLLPKQGRPEEEYRALARLGDLTEDSDERVRVALRMAELNSRHLDRVDESIALYKGILVTHPAHPGALRGLEEGYERQEAWAELARHLEVMMRRATAPEEVLRIQRKLGMIKGTRLGSTDEAIASWNEILRRDPNDVQALEALSDVLRNTADYEGLFGALKRLIPLKKTSEGLKAVRFEMAEILLAQLGRVEEAREVAKRILEIEPHTVSELMRLEELFGAAGALTDVVKVMARRAELAETRGERVEVLLEIAETCQTRLGRPASAASTFEEVLRLEPPNGRAYSALINIYQASGDYRRLLDLHGRQLEQLESVDERRKLLVAIVRIQRDHLGQAELAFTAACRAISETGLDEELQLVAEELAEETDNWEILVDVLEDQLESISGDRLVYVRHRLAAMYADRIGQSDEAERHLRLILELRPAEAEAIEQLGLILERERRWDELVTLLQHSVDRTTSLAQKKHYLRGLCRVSEERGDSESAARASTQILDLDPSDEVAVYELVRLHQKRQEWPALLRILERRSALAMEPDEKALYQLEIAKVYELGLGDPARAIENYEEVLGFDPQNLVAIGALERLYAEGEHWSALVDVLAKRIDLVETTDQKVNLLERLSSIWGTNLGDLAQAAGALQRVLSLAPNHMPAVLGLERLYRDQEAWAELVETYERHILIASDASERAQVNVQEGNVLLDALRNSRAAQVAFDRAIQADPSNAGAYYGLARISETEGNWQRALELIQRETRLLGVSDAASDAHYRAGRILLEELGDSDGARRAFRSALDILPSNHAANAGLRVIYGALENHAALVDLFEQEGDFSNEPVDKSRAYQEAADIALDGCGDVERAMQLYAKALEVKPDHVPALRVYSDLLFSAESWEDARTFTLRFSECLDPDSDRDELCQIHYRLAYVSELLGDLRDALKHYMKSYEANPSYLPTLEGLGAALVRAEQWEDAQRIFKNILAHHRDAVTEAEVVEIHHQLGQIALWLGQLDRAERSFARALELDPTHSAGLKDQALLLEHQKRFEEAYDLRDRYIRAAPQDDSDRFEELMKQATLCRDHLHDPYRALDVLSEARRVSPGNPEILRDMSKLLRATNHHPQAIDVLRELEAGVDALEEKRAIHLEIADIATEGQMDIGLVNDALNKALDLDPGYVNAFERLETVLSERRQWALLEENYRRMIQRLPPERKAMKAVLFRSLGDLHFKVLKNEQGAKQAYEVVLRHSPQDQEVALRLVDLYSLRPEDAPKAIELCRRMLPDSEDPTAILQRLLNEFGKVSDYDKALCAIAALRWQGGASSEQLEWYQTLLKRVPQNPSGALSEELWRGHLFHPDCRTEVADLLRLVYETAADLLTARFQQKAIKKKEEVPLSAQKQKGKSGLLYFDVWQTLANAMRIDSMQHAHRAGSTEAPSLLISAEQGKAVPWLYAGDLHDTFRLTSRRHLKWRLARQLTLARPEFAPVAALAPVDVVEVLEALVRLIRPEGSGLQLVEMDMGRVGQWYRFLAPRVPRAVLEPRVNRCLQSGAMSKVASFFEGVEHTASRVAFLMCGDVDAAERGLGDADAIYPVSLESRRRALMLFTLSEDHFTLRQALRLRVQQ
jgi:golgin subfamily B member 1